MSRQVATRPQTTTPGPRVASPCEIGFPISDRKGVGGKHSAAAVVRFRLEPKSHRRVYNE